MRTVLVMLGAALIASASASAQTVAITGATVLPVSGPRIENATVVIRDGRIAAVGTNVAIPADARRVDGAGKWVTPGLINAYTALGLVEIGLSGPGSDQSAKGKDGIAASFRAWEGVDPTSAYFAPAREEGVTTVLVHPTGGLIPGQAAVLDLVEGSVRDMLRAAPVAMALQFGTGTPANVNARGELIGRLREIFDDVRQYARRRDQCERAQTRPFAGSRLDLEALVPVVEGRLPLLVNVDKASDIEAVLNLAREFSLKAVLVGATEGWMVASQIAAAKVPVMVGAQQNIPQFGAMGARQDNAALLARAGVRVALVSSGSNGEEFNVRNIKQDAGNAVAYGLPWDDALRAVTLTPAEIFGIADKTGSLQVGREANVVVWSGDPFEFSSVAEHVFVRGREITTPSRQSLLERRYRRLPATFRPPPPR